MIFISGSARAFGNTIRIKIATDDPVEVKTLSKNTLDTLIRYRLIGFDSSIAHNGDDNFKKGNVVFPDSYLENVSLKMRLFHYPYDVDIQNIKADLDISGFRPATWPELVSYVITSRVNWMDKVVLEYENNQDIDIKFPMIYSVDSAFKDFTGQVFYPCMAVHVDLDGHTWPYKEWLSIID